MPLSRCLVIVEKREKTLNIAVIKYFRNDTFEKNYHKGDFTLRGISALR